MVEFKYDYMPKNNREMLIIKYTSAEAANLLRSLNQEQSALKQKG
ncbi:hypothetical protein [Anaerotignum sp. MB30-C6]|nr:hypothetical protein [Anaerotignum sp. MB30-C6]WMI82041.1 hypothetical protein RBQ60_04730 [Anaerotignum sp. MB30-C6]